nr:rhodanese-like domain-containing protein [Aeromicrobium massiliense]
MSGPTPEVDIEFLAQALARGAAVVDVRESREYVTGHVPGSAMVPMAQLPSRMTDLDSDQAVYLVCATGNRSSAMTDLLRAAGYDAYSVAGGTTAWTRSGRALETRRPPTDEPS